MGPVKMLQPQTLLDAGKLVITVFKANNIEKKGMFGKADPYVKLTLGKKKTQSPTVKNNHNPEWNFKASFDIDRNISEDIQIEVFDEDLGQDDSLGHTSLNISSVQKQKQLLNQWIPLESCKPGEVLISAEFIALSNIKESEEHGAATLIKKDNLETVQTVEKLTIKKEERVSEVNISTQKSFEKGAKGLKDTLKKESIQTSDSTPQAMVVEEKLEKKI